jgi:hypothetical protein
VTFSVEAIDFYFFKISLGYNLIFPVVRLITMAIYRACSLLRKKIKFNIILFFYNKLRCEATNQFKLTKLIRARLFLDWSDLELFWI